MEKRVIVIGGTSGIGREVAKIYARQGCRVGVTGRRAGLLQEFRDENPGREIFTRAFDVTSEDAASELESLVKEMGGVDICLYSSGYGHTNSVLEPSLELGQIDVNVKGFVRCAVYLFNYWAESGQKGHLAVLSSVASVKPLGVCPAYSSTKKFEAFYCECLRQLARVREAAIDITVIKPGFVDTDFIKGRHFPFTISREKAGKAIVRAIRRKRKRTVIDGWWSGLTVLMNMIPSCLWTFGGRYFRPHRDMF